MRREEHRHLRLHGFGEAVGHAVDFLLDGVERGARAFGQLVGVGEAGDVELLDVGEYVAHGVADVLREVGKKIVFLGIESLQDEVELGAVFDEELAHALAGLRLARGAGVERPRVVVEEKVGHDVADRRAVRRHRAALVNRLRDGRGDFHARIDFRRGRLRKVIVHFYHRAGVVRGRRLFRDVFRREFAIHGLYGDIAQFGGRVGRKHHGQRARHGGGGLGIEFARPGKRNRAALHVVERRQRAGDDLLREGGRLGRDFVFEQSHETLRVERRAHREAVVDFHGQSPTGDTLHLHGDGADTHGLALRAGGERAGRLEKLRRLPRHKLRLGNGDFARKELLRVLHPVGGEVVDGVFHDKRRSQLPAFKNFVFGEHLEDVSRRHVLEWFPEDALGEFGEAVELVAAHRGNHGKAVYLFVDIDLDLVVGAVERGQIYAHRGKEIQDSRGVGRAEAANAHGRREVRRGKPASGLVVVWNRVVVLVLFQGNLFEAAGKRARARLLESFPQARVKIGRETRGVVAFRQEVAQRGSVAIALQRIRDRRENKAFQDWHRVLRNV